MPSSRHPHVVLTASILVLLAFAIRVPELITASYVWYGVGAVYALTFVLAGSAWHRLGRPLEFVETVAVAAAVVAGIVLLASLRVQYTTSSLLSWSPVLVLFLAPAAFMLPLGAATTWRQRLGVVGVVALPPLYWLADVFVLGPVGSDPGFAPPTMLLTLSALWSLLSAAAGGPLLVLGHWFAREEGSLLDAARRWTVPGTG